MNRTVAALMDYPNLLDQVASELTDGVSHVYLVTDAGFAPDAQIWTEQDKRELLRDYARGASSVYRGGTFDECLSRLTENFNSSREIFYVEQADLAAAREALAA